MAVLTVLACVMDAWGSRTRGQHRGPWWPRWVALDGRGLASRDSCEGPPGNTPNDCAKLEKSWIFTFGSSSVPLRHWRRFGKVLGDIVGLWGRR